MLIFRRGKKIIERERTALKREMLRFEKAKWVSDTQCRCRVDSGFDWATGYMAAPLALHYLPKSIDLACIEYFIDR